MSRRYFFICGDRTTVTGGKAVIYDTVAALRQAGYDAAIVYSDHGADLSHLHALPHIYTPELRKVLRKYGGRRHAIEENLNLLHRTILKKPRKTLALQPNDVLIVPEFLMPEAMEAFPNRSLGVFVQNSFAFMRSYVRGLDRGLDIRGQDLWFIGIADICMDQFKMLGINRTLYLPVSMRPDEFSYQETKNKLITYMPRKRPWEARIIQKVLRDRLRPDYQIESIDNMPSSLVAKKLQESLIFISLLKTEALGFPAAEAMAAGCITVGFTGLGTEEYFDNTTGIPVPEGDITALVSAVEATVQEYETNPTRLDAMRRRASERINARYSQAVFESNLLKIWSKLPLSRLP